MDADREVQFHAAMLDLGPVNCAGFLNFDPTGEPRAWERRADRESFYAHKQQLLRWLAWNSIVSVYDKHPDPMSADVIEVLSHDAAKWVGEFYQWLFKMQGGKP